MSWVAVAEKDFRDAIRSRLILVVAGLFVLFTAGGAGIGKALGLGGGDAVGLIMFVMLSATGIFVPIIAIGLSYRSIAGERDTGSLKILLSLPNSRADVVLGKFVGRSAVLTVTVVVGFTAGLVAMVAAFAGQGEFGFPSYAAFMLTTLLLGLVFVSITVGISAFTTSTFRAAVGAVGIFVVFEWLWNILARVIWYAANGFEQPQLGQEPPDWLEFVYLLNPNISYSQATSWLIDQVASTDQQPTNLDPFGLEPWFGFVVLAWWIALPLAVGYLRFEATDL